MQNPVVRCPGVPRNFVSQGSHWRTGDKPVSFTTDFMNDEHHYFTYKDKDSIKSSSTCQITLKALK